MKEESRLFEIYKEILRSNFSFPNDNNKVSKANSLIKCLLKKKVNERICNVSSLKKKPFFEGFDFDKLVDLRLKPPYKPTKHNFDRYLKENNPYESWTNHLLKLKKNKSCEISYKLNIRQSSAWNENDVKSAICPTAFP